MFLKMVSKAAGSEHFVKICRNISMTEFTVREVTVFRVAIFFIQALHQI